MKFQQGRIILLLSLYYTISLFSLHAVLDQPNGEDFIKKSCKESSYPDICYASLSPFASQVQNSSEKLAAVSISFCLSKVQPLIAHIEDLSQKITDPELSESLKDCIENFDDAVDDIKKSIEQMKNIRAPGAISNVQTWMSGALSFEVTCVDDVKDVLDGPVKTDVLNQTEEVEKFTSISLAMIDLFAHSK